MSFYFAPSRRNPDTETLVGGTVRPAYVFIQNDYLWDLVDDIDEYARGREQQRFRITQSAASIEVDHPGGRPFTVRDVDQLRALATQLAGYWGQL